jgi:hypothetical protein
VVALRRRLHIFSSFDILTLKQGRSNEEFSAKEIVGVLFLDKVCQNDTLWVLVYHGILGENNLPRKTKFEVDYE